MSAILNSLNTHNFLIFQPILMILVSKFMVYRALTDKTYLLLGLQSPLTFGSGELKCGRGVPSYSCAGKSCLFKIITTSQKISSH